MDDNNINDIANDIVQQLKQSTELVNSAQQNTVLPKEELEQFILNKSSVLIDQSMEVINNLKGYIQAGADAKEILAFAEVVKASSSALEALNKIYISNEKSKTATNLKQMDINAKVSIASQDNATKLLVSREELMKQLIEDSQKVIDIAS